MQFVHVAPFQPSLRLLRLIAPRIRFKTMVLALKAVSRIAPIYLQDLRPICLTLNSVTSSNLNF